MHSVTHRFSNLSFFKLFLFIFFIAFFESCKTVQPVAAVPEKTEEATDTVKEFTENIPATDIAFDMVLIPEGSFMMGSPESQANRKAHEGPVKKVELDAFYMGKYELGWEAFELFFKQNKNMF
ncbi:MAG: SUMF1/EgtB/PvdO family nonheme iron enzyme, partial [Arenibacter sp.]|nr:SUMF1/EgtB/PvdO family nonheme iron enzyme [Arenibacter sp.]